MSKIKFVDSTKTQKPKELENISFLQIKHSCYTIWDIGQKTIFLRRHCCFLRDSCCGKSFPSCKRVELVSTPVFKHFRIHATLPEKRNH